MKGAAVVPEAHGRFTRNGRGLPNRPAHASFARLTPPLAVPAPSSRPSEAILQGAIAPALLKLAGPVVLANVFQTVYQLTDTFWVGRLGADADQPTRIKYKRLTR